MTDILSVVERRWVADEFVQVNEHITGDPGNPVVFGLQLKINPLTRRQLVAVRDLIERALAEVPETHILVPPGAGKLARPA